MSEWDTGRPTNADENSVASRLDLAHFVKAMHADLVEHPHDWENNTLDRFLEALAAFIEDGGEPRDPLTWQSFALLLKAASGYE